MTVAAPVHTTGTQLPNYTTIQTKSGVQTVPDTAGGPITPTPAQIPTPASVLPSTSPTSGTVLSNANVIENTIPKLNNTASSLTTAPPASLVLPETDYGTLYGQAYAGLPDETQDPVYKQEMDLINNLQSENDSTTNTSINSIMKSYTDMAGAKSASDASTTAGLSNSLLLAGNSRYAPASAAGILDAKTTTDLKDLSDLQDQENQQIATVKQAQANQDYQDMEKQLGILDGIRTNKQQLASSIATNMQTQNQAQRTQQIQASRDGAIAGLVQQGVTDPAQILQMLNTYDDGSSTGGDFTADEVSKALTSISQNLGAMSADKLTGDVKNFTVLKNTPGGLPASILALPPEQQMAAYISLVNQAKKGVVSGSNSSSTTASPSGGTPSGTPATPGTSPDLSGLTAGVTPDQKAFLGTLSGDLPILVQGLADYSINPTSIPVKNYKGASGYTQPQLIALAKQYDPTYDAKQYASRAAMQKSVTSGTYSQTINAANTLVQHLSELNDAYKSLGNGGVLPGILNAGKNAFQQVGGSGTQGAFTQAANAVATEAAKVYKGGAPTESEIAEQTKLFNQDMSPGQFKAALNTMLTLMTGRLGTLASQYKNTMGTTSGFSILTPQSVSVLKNLGLDPAKVDPTYDQTTDPGGSSPDELLQYASSGNSASAYDPSEWAKAK